MLKLLKALKKLLIILFLNVGVLWGNDTILLSNNNKATSENNFKEEWLKAISDQECRITINDSLVIIELIKHNIPFIKDFLIQIKKESRNYKSKLSLEYNNITGMKQPRIRKTLATGTNKYQHASFNSWQECVEDLKHFIEFSPPHLNETFIQFMKRRGYNFTFK